jgi:hypothetical protein
MNTAKYSTCLVDAFHDPCHATAATRPSPAALTLHSPLPHFADESTPEYAARLSLTKTSGCCVCPSSTLIYRARARPPRADEPTDIIGDMNRRLAALSTLEAAGGATH